MVVVTVPVAVAVVVKAFDVGGSWLTTELLFWLNLVELFLRKDALKEPKWLLNEVRELFVCELFSSGLDGDAEGVVVESPVVLGGNAKVCPEISKIKNCIY